MQCLENGAFYFTKITKNNNLCFDYKVVEDKDSKKNGKEAVTNLKEANKKKV